MKSFGLAIGIAAIDGLTCAFVAMLVLALVLIGSGEGSSAPDASQSVAISIGKRDPASKGIVNLQLLLNIVANDGGGKQTSAIISPSALVRSVPLEISALRPLVRRGGGVLWSDCLATSITGCESRLLLVLPKKGTQWSVSLRAVDSAGSLVDEFSTEVALTVRLLAVGGPLETCPVYKLDDGSGKPSKAVGFSVSVPAGGRASLSSCAYR